MLAVSGRRVRAGMSLVECLVALVVLSIGLLGMAGLMIDGLRNGRAALFRTQAINLVSDMAERIRANAAGGSAYECALYPGGPLERNCAASDSAFGASCTRAELAEDDLARWHETARAALPLGSDAPCVANVEYAAPGGSDEPAQFHISLSWHEPWEPNPLVHESDLLLVPPS
jgi:type IV pilus assembly protein PilV